MRTWSPLATSQSYICFCCDGSGCSSSHTSAPRPDGRSRVIRSWAPYLSADRLELVELIDVLPGHHHGDLRLAEPGLGEVLQCPDRHVVAAGAADVVVDLGGGAVEGDLHVDVVGAGQLRRPLLVELDAVGGELDPDLVVDGVVEQLPEVGPHGGLAAADVDVEDLHLLQLVDHGLGLGGGQLTRVAPPRRGQAVRAGQVAGVGELPREADRGVEAVLEVLNQLHGTLLDRAAGQQTGQGTQVGGALLLGHPGGLDRGVHIGMVGEPGDDHDQLRGLQERQLPGTRSHRPAPRTAPGAAPRTELHR